MRYEERSGQYLDQYHDDVISRLGQLEPHLLLEPGDAKLQLRASKLLQGAVQVHHQPSRASKGHSSKYGSPLSSMESLGTGSAGHQVAGLPAESAQEQHDQ
jgi:hypothetical protein